ncbi:hypothetical protein N431DRAFT_430247 [Stipitochalara longipes BDJ]|nr:hypothetical protein N431DRAFT_430247 [Stipitochalara longipes BDJ]
MAEDFVELGIEGIDKLVDKHFHKMPNKYIDPHTYHPRCRNRGRGGNRSDEDGESDAGDDGASGPRTEDSYQNQRINRSFNENGYGYGYLPPSQQMRDPGIQDGWTRRRPEGLVRRSSSQPGQFRESDIETERRPRRRRRSLSDERKPNDAKTRSRGGKGHGKGPSKTDAVSLTLFGIAAASLAASGVMSVIKHRDRTRDIEENVKGGGREERGDRGENLKAGKRERSRGSHRDQRAEGRRIKGGGGGRR